LVVLRTEMLRDAPSVGRLVERILLEADREALDRSRVELGHERGDRARIEAAAQQHTDGNVTDQLLPDGVTQHLAQPDRVVSPVDGRLALAPGKAQAPVGPRVNAALVEAQDVAR